MAEPLGEAAAGEPAVGEELLRAAWLPGAGVDEPAAVEPVEPAAAGVELLGVALAEAEPAAEPADLPGEAEPDASVEAGPAEGLVDEGAALEVGDPESVVPTLTEVALEPAGLAVGGRGVATGGG